MARYIDADELIAALQPTKNSKWNKNDHSASRSEMIADFCTELENWRTADVVPKSEVAREIFEEIYKTMNSIYGEVQRSCVGRHPDSPETMRLIGELNGIKHLGSEFAELKKKYTEATT